VARAFILVEDQNDSGSLTVDRTNYNVTGILVAQFRARAGLMYSAEAFCRLVHHGRFAFSFRDALLSPPPLDRVRLVARVQYREPLLYQYCGPAEVLHLSQDRARNLVSHHIHRRAASRSVNPLREAFRRHVIDRLILCCILRTNDPSVSFLSALSCCLS
jgi:hypothetical protein